MSRTATARLSGVVGVALLVGLAVALTLVLFPSSVQSITQPVSGFTRLASAYSVDESYTTSQ